MPVTGDTVPYSEAFLEYAPASSHGIYKGYLGLTFFLGEYQIYFIECVENISIFTSA